METDDRTPSFRLSVNISVKHSTGEFKYVGDNFWIATTAFDEFLNELTSVVDAKNDITATLRDMSSYLIFGIQNKGNQHEFAFSILEPGVSNPKCAFRSTGQLERSCVEYVLSQFRDMPRWW